MNLDRLMTWILGIVVAAAAVGQLDRLQKWIWQAEAKVIYESRTSTWGSPRFFATGDSHPTPSRRESSQSNKRK